MVQLRSLTLEDIPRLPELIVGYESNAVYRVKQTDTGDEVMFRLCLEPLAEPFDKHWTPSTEDLAHYAAVVSSGHSIAAWDGEILAGAAVAERQNWNQALLIWEFHVREGYHRLGIGHQIMEKMVSIAQQCDVRVIVCETQNTNVPAIQFYRAMGFTVDGLDISLYSNHDLAKGEIAMIMKRKLIS